MVIRITVTTYEMMNIVLTGEHATGALPAMCQSLSWSSRVCVIVVSGTVFYVLAWLSSRVEVP